MVGRSSAAVRLLYRDLRGAGRAVLIYTRCAARDTITITITTTTTTTVSTSVQTTYLPLRRLATVISRVLLLRGILVRMMLWNGCGCGLERSWMRREALGLIRGLIPIRTRMWTRARERERMRMRTMIVFLGCGLVLERPTRIEYALINLHQRLSSHTSVQLSPFPHGAFLSF